MNGNQLKSTAKAKQPNVLSELLKPYFGLFALSLLIIVLANGLNLALPKLIGNYIDSFVKDSSSIGVVSFTWLGVLILAVFVFGMLQNVLSIYLSEKIAFDLRQKMVNKLSKSSFRFVNQTGAGEIITNFSSDVSNVKSIASQGFVYLFQALVLLIGSCILLLLTNFKLALIALSILPIIIIVFVFIFRQITPLFKVTQKNLSKINQVVNESIFGSSVIRVLNSQSWEDQKFAKVNTVAKDISLKVVGLFSLLIPSINLVSNLATVIILFVGGRQIVDQSLTLGQFTSFITYYNLLITPIFILGFTSQGFSRGFVSYSRIKKILEAPSEEAFGSHNSDIKGDISVKNLNLEVGGRKILKNINFDIKAGSRTAILGPTGAGKSQLFTLLIGLNEQTSGEIMIDGIPLNEWDRDSLLSQVGMVFQDSLVFQGSLKENIVFSNMVSDKNLDHAVYASKLDEFVESLENGLETQVSERGGTLSGGQKQRLMLARSLAIKPKILLLDDFTARVDSQTESQIWERLHKTYEDITLVSITQKIDSVKDFDQIIVLMEGELLASGTHEELLKTSPEYKQIFDSQQIIES